MYKYKTIILHLDDLLSLISSDEVSTILTQLKNQNYEPVALVSKSMFEDLKSNETKIFDHFSTRYFYQNECDLCAIISSCLNDLKRASAVVVGHCPELVLAANRTLCLTLSTEEAFADVFLTNYSLLPGVMHKVNTVFYALAVEIVLSKNPSQAYLVGINGVDASGKSHFTKDFSKYLKKQGSPTKVIHLDDFHNPSEIRASGQTPVQAYMDKAFNTDKIANVLLEPLRRDGRVSCKLKLLDLLTDRYTVEKTYNLSPSDIVLLEGVLLFRPPLNTYFDYRIYLDISFDEVLKRASQRDVDLFGSNVINKYKTKYIPVQEAYIDQHKPKAQANTVIDNHDFNRPFFIKHDQIKG